MGEEVKIDVIRTTQNSLSKYIKKPPLTEKLLKKPPFRYLHDITTAVMKETGYLQGLYTQDELNPENIKDRDAKIAFLEKLIAAVNLSTGISITARPNKIVAGLDVAKTNELLQAIGKALDKKIDSSKAVEQVLSKKSKGATQQKKEHTKDKTIKDKKAADTKSRDSDTLKKKTRDKVKNVEKPEPRKGKQSKDASPTKPSKLVNNQESSKEDATKVNSRSEEEKSSEVSALACVEEPSESQNENVPETEKLHDPEPKHDVKPPPPSPAVDLEQPDHKAKEKEFKEERKEKPKRDKRVEKTDSLEKQQDSFKELQELKLTASSKDDVSKPGEELKRPQSARAVHRKKVLKKSNVSEVVVNQEGKSEEVLSPEKLTNEPKDLSTFEKKLPQETSLSEGAGKVVARESKRPRTAARPASARPGAPRVRDRGTVLLNENDNKELSEPVNLIVDSKELPKDDDETLVTVEAPSTEIAVDQVVDESHLLSGDQGHLVSQILETQKELEENAGSETGPESVHKVDISWSSGRQEAVAREVEKLRSAIQALTRAVNPLGKLIDFLQEDVDSMQTELETWVATNQQLAQQLLAEQSLTDESIEPLARQLEDIEQLVEEQLEEMSVVKANIIRNDERLARLLKTNTSRVPG